MSELPSGWKIIPISAVCGEITAHEARPFSQVSKGYTRFRDGDVIFAKITPCMENGKIAIAKDLHNGIACGSTEFHVLRSKGDVLPEYIWRYLRQESFRTEAQRTMSGAVGQQRVPAQYLKDSVIPLPPPAEQRRIVARLDALLGRLTAARAELARVPRLAERNRQAVLAAAFSGELTREWREGNPVETAKWSEAPLSELAEIGTGATPKRGNTRYYADGVIPWVTSAVVNDALVDHAEEMITEDALRETNCKVFPIGTLLVAMYGEGQTRGRVSILGIAAATNQALAAVQVKEPGKAIREFVLWFLRSQYLEIRQKAAGGVQPNLNLGIIKGLRLPLPPLPEQREIVRRISAALARIDRAEAEAARAAGLVERLEQETLARAFRGEL